MQSALGCFTRDGQAVCSLANRKLFHVAQQDHLAIEVGQGFQPAHQVDAQFILRDVGEIRRLMPFDFSAPRIRPSRLVTLKTPSIDLRGDPAYVKRFLTEEWIARRINSAHVLEPCLPTLKRRYIYGFIEFIEGQTLAKWMVDSPRPRLEAVRGVMEQIAKGLRAFHRLEMLHQDLRPENIMIDKTGTVKIIDFGFTRVASIMKAATHGHQKNMLGTAQYSASEYFLGEPVTPQLDLFSLGVITCQMLAGKLPYGAEVAKSRTRAAQNNLRYGSALHHDREIRAWIDGALKKAVRRNPAKL